MVKIHPLDFLKRQNLVFAPIQRAIGDTRRGLE